MRKIVFAFVCSFIALGWMGCERNIQTDIPFFEEIFSVKIDSAASCCGIDSFAIKSPWMQKRINSFLADSAQRMQDIYSELQFQYFRDSLGDDYVIENTHLLRDCEGTLLEDLTLNQSVADMVWGSTYLEIYDLVEIIIGLDPCYPDNFLKPNSSTEK